MKRVFFLMLFHLLLLLNDYYPSGIFVILVMDFSCEQTTKKILYDWLKISSQTWSSHKLDFQKSINNNTSIIHNNISSFFNKVNIHLRRNFPESLLLLIIINYRNFYGK